jgi:predicted tellurium resistance membrane protein TerC
VLMGIAADLLARLLQKHRWIAWVGLAIVAYVAVRMILTGWHAVSPHLPPGILHRIQGWISSARQSVP